MNRFLLQIFHKLPRVDLRKEAWNQRIERESYEHKRVLYMPFDQLRVSAIDSETTGFHPENGDEILSLAAVQWQDGVCENPFHSYVKIEGKIPPHISELTGIEQKDLAGSFRIKEVLPEFLNYVDSTVMIGYYIGHDIRFLNYYLWKNYQTRIQHRVLEVGKVVELLHPELRDASFDQVCSYFDVHITDRHTALGDALAVTELWSKLIFELKEKRIGNLITLYEQFVIHRK